MSIDRQVLWVVEMWNDETRSYEATVGVGLNRADGRDKKKQWEKRNPGDKFRLEKYDPSWYGHVE